MQLTKLDSASFKRMQARINKNILIFFPAFMENRIN